MIIVFLIEYIYYIYIFCLKPLSIHYLNAFSFSSRDRFCGRKFIHWGWYHWWFQDDSEEHKDRFLVSAVHSWGLHSWEGLRFFGICALNYAFFLRRRYQWLRLSIFLISTIMTGPFASATHITIISHSVRQSMPILLKTNPGPLLVTSK